MSAPGCAGSCALVQPGGICTGSPGPRGRPHQPRRLLGRASTAPRAHLDHQAYPVRNRGVADGDGRRDERHGQNVVFTPKFWRGSGTCRARYAGRRGRFGAIVFRRRSCRGPPAASGRRTRTGRRGRPAARQAHAGAQLRYGAPAITPAGSQRPTREGDSATGTGRQRWRADRDGARRPAPGRRTARGPRHTAREAAQRLPGRSATRGDCGSGTRRPAAHRQAAWRWRGPTHGSTCNPPQPSRHRAHRQAHGHIYREHDRAP